MTNEDDFFNLDIPQDSAMKNEDTGGGDTGNNILNTPFAPAPINLAGKVVERKLHTIVTFRLYPNGMLFPVSSVSWFDKQQQEVKKKPKKLAEPKQVTIKEDETY